MLVLRTALFHCVLVSLLAECGHARFQKKNLLFIMFDDLRPELSVYGMKHIHTPNFERLASRGVVFDAAYAQVAVCCPSRYSMLTGQRPDATGNYNFESGNTNVLMSIPRMFTLNGYISAGYGKVFHKENNVANSDWNYEQFNNNWYQVQNQEDKLYMNSTITPDKNWREEEFPDHFFTTRAIDTIRAIVRNNTNVSMSSKPFLVGLGFKLPHLALHVPFKYFDMYRNQATASQFDQERRMWPYHFHSKADLSFPLNAPEQGYSMSNSRHFLFMNHEGERKYRENTSLMKSARAPFPKRAHLELAWGYAAAISFLDAQIGRLLDLLDELKLWDNTAVILTSDHGMHLGEKGFWNKWSLYDESTRVPLIISDPAIPRHHRGRHYRYPVELLDIFPTVMDMFPYIIHCPPNRRGLRLLPPPMCPRLHGKSLIKVLYGNHHSTDTDGQEQDAVSAPDMGSISYGLKYISSRIPLLSKLFTPRQPLLPKLNMTFAVSQVLKCAKTAEIPRKHEINALTSGDTGVISSDLEINNLWKHCSTSPKTISKTEILEETSLMGYSFRLVDAQYIIWLQYDRLTCRLNISQQYDARSVPVPYAEEYYLSRHSGADRRLKNVNVFGKVDVKITTRFRRMALSFILKKKYMKRSKGCLSGF